MNMNLKILLLVLSFIIMFATLMTVSKKKIPIRYGIMWFAISICLLLLGLFPKLFMFVSNFFGFEVMSNMIVSVFIGLLLVLVFLQTIMISKLKARIITLTQEVALLNKEK